MENPKKKIGNYQYLKLIGKGAFSEVYLAADKSQELRAIKQIPKKNLIQNLKLKELIRQEVQILKACNSPNITKFYDFIETSNNIYIILEYCKDGDLKQFIKKYSPLEEKKAIEIFKQILNGFKGLHNVGAMHRDFKPENVLVDGENYKICDLGFGKIADLAKTTLGTLLYMAPEVINDQGKYDSKIDIWSLGAVFYEILFKEPLFNGKNEANVVNQICNEKISFPKEIKISDQCKDLIKKMLKKDPVNRITWKDIYLHPLINNTKLKENDDIGINATANAIRLKTSINFYNKPLPPQMIIKEDGNFNFEVHEVGELELKEKLEVDIADLIQTNSKKQKKEKKRLLKIERKYTYIRNLLNHINNVMNRALTLTAKEIQIQYGFLAFFKNFERKCSVLLSEIENKNLFEMKDFEKFKKSDFFIGLLQILSLSLEDIRKQLNFLLEKIESQQKTNLMKDLAGMLGNSFEDIKFHEIYKKISKKFCKHIEESIESAHANIKDKLGVTYIYYLDCYLWDEIFLFSDKIDSGFDFEGYEKEWGKVELQEILNLIFQKKKSIKERNFNFELDFAKLSN